MRRLAASFRRWVFGIPARATSFEARGFRGGGGGVRERLEQIGRTFVWGYHAAIEEGDLNALGTKLKSIDLELQGFAFEGAAMGLALWDLLIPWRRNRLRSFLQADGKDQPYMVHVGAGWILARTPGKVGPRLLRFDPLLRWLVVDGYGFHEGFFRWPRYIQGQAPPARLVGYERRAFDQGFGRCLWFIEGGEVERILQTMAVFPEERRADLWSGVGLAATYAGGVGESELKILRECARKHRPHLAQGAAFAVKARQRGGNVTPHTEAACAVLCGLSVEQAAQLTDLAGAELPPDGAEPAYEIWRKRVRQRFATEGQGPAVR